MESRARGYAPMQPLGAVGEDVGVAYKRRFRNFVCFIVRDDIQVDMFKMRCVSKQQTQSEVIKYAERVSAEDVMSTVGNARKFRLLFQSVEKLSPYWDDVGLTFSMLKDFSIRRYTKCPWRTIAILVGGLAYVMTPLDLIPDFIPIVGWSDDCLAIAGVLSFAKLDLDNYKRWKNKGNRSKGKKLLSVK